MVKIVRRKDHVYRPYFRGDGLSRTALWEQPGLTFELFKLEKGSGFEDHFHDCWEMLFIISGEMDLSGERLGPGDFIFSEPGDSHWSKNLTDVTLLLGFGGNYD